MSTELSEEQGGPKVGIAIDTAPENKVPPVTEISAMGMHGMPQHISPYHQQSQSDGQTSRAAGSNTSTAFRGSIVHEEDDRSEKIKGRRAWMTLVATIAASITYQAGLNPPGGFWQADDSQGHRAGSSVLHDEHLLGYQIFYYCNATAFVTSLAMIMVLVSDRLFTSESKVLALGFTICINVASLFGAYAAGSTLSSTSTIIFVVITCVFFVIVVYITEYVSSSFDLSRL